MRHVFRLLLSVSFWALMTMSIHAQTLAIQSGEHAEFTRLVLPIGADRDWNIVQQPDGQWELTLTPAVDGFDTSTTFDVIPRTRVSDLIAGQTLILDLACNCGVSSFRHATEYLVIDVTDPDPDAPAPSAADAMPDTAATEASEALPDLAGLLRSPAALPQVTPIAPPSPEATPDDTEVDEPNPRLAEAAQIMAEQLARAAASGLLDVALDEPMYVGDPSEPGSSAPSHSTPDSYVAVEEPVEEGDTSLPIRAETAFDTAFQLDRPIGPPREPMSCTGDPFNVADWTDGYGFDQGLGPLRRDLYDERDVLRSDGAIALAQHYLFYGFGAEATYWLTHLSSPPESLLHLAALVDGAETAAFIPVQSTENCSQGELLWRYLAGAVANPLSGDDTAAIQRAFGELPTQLRDHMGPRLAAQLADDGYGGTARNIRDILHRGGRIPMAALRLLDLELGIDLDAHASDTRHNLAEAMRDDGGDPVSVLTHALAFDRSVGTLPPTSRLVTADALIREVGNGPETDELWLETLLGHAALGQIDEALDRLNDPTRPQAIRAEALTELIENRVEVGDTASLVILAYTHGHEWRPEGSAAGRIQVRAIAALRDAGLFEAAQILRDVRRPLILPAPSAEPAEQEDAATAAWLARDWDRLAEAGSGTHADVATRLSQLGTDAAPPVAAEGAPDLNALNEALDDSRSLRTALTDLLAEPALP